MASEEKREEFLFHNTIPFSIVRPDIRLALDKWYGKEHAEGVSYVEEFEIAEYGRQMKEEDVFELFPMITRMYKVSGKSEWYDTGIDVMDGQKISFESRGKILWNLRNKEYSDPDGAVPYSRWESKPMPGAGTGALIGKIGENSSEYFFIGKDMEVHAFISGRLYLGINDGLAHDNEGLYRVRIKTTK